MVTCRQQAVISLTVYAILAGLTRHVQQIFNMSDEEVQLNLIKCLANPKRYLHTLHRPSVNILTDKARMISFS